jgi:hypothetical protein
MMRSSFALAVAAVAAVAAGCKSKAPSPGESARPTPTAPAIDAPPAPAAPAAAADWRTPEDLWNAYRDAHVGATPGNAVATGRRLWPMLGSDAHDLVTTGVHQQLQALGAAAAHISPDELAYKLLGEIAAARAPFITGGELRAVTPKPDSLINGRRIGSATIQIRKGAEPPVELELERVDGSWRFKPGPGLLPDESAVFKTPAGGEGAQGSASLDAVVARWTQVLETGTGWDAYNVMSPAMRKRLLDMIAQVGGNGAGDVAKVFEKTIVDRRNNGIHVQATKIDDRSADRGTIAVTYSNGSTDTFAAVRADGAWWIEMPM